MATSTLPWIRVARHGVIVVAASTGGPTSLVRLFQGLPKGFPAPIVIVQHLPSDSTSGLALRLDEIGTVPCSEAQHGQLLSPGHAVLAPAGKHITLDSRGRLCLETGDPDALCPSGNVLFASAADVFKDQVLGVILSGMGSDGAEGALAIRRAGGVVYGESEKTCAYYGMPRAALESGGVDALYPIDALPKALFARVCSRTALISRVA